MTDYVTNNCHLGVCAHFGVFAQALAGLPSLAMAAARLPPVHVDEDGERFIITADVPGLSKDDIKVRRGRRRTGAWLGCGAPAHAQPRI